MCTPQTPILFRFFSLFTKLLRTEVKSNLLLRLLLLLFLLLLFVWLLWFLVLLLLLLFLDDGQRATDLVTRIAKMAAQSQIIGYILHISHQKFKNYMRSVIPKTRAFICDQSQLRSSFRSKVISEKR